MTRRGVMPVSSKPFDGRRRLYRSSRRHRCQILALILLSAVLANCGQRAELSAGTKFEKPLGLEERHRYSVALQPGQFARIVVDQRFLHVEAVLLDPTGQELGKVESRRVMEPRHLAVVAETPGQHLVEIRALESERPDGSYSVELQEVRLASERDRAWLTAEAIYQEAEALRRERRDDRRRQALEEFRTAQELFDELEDPVGLAKTELGIGSTYGLLHDHTRALIHSRKALALWQQVAGPLGEVDALNSIAYSLRREEPGDPTPAIEAYLQAAERLRRVAMSQPPGTNYRRLLEHRRAWILNSLAFTYGHSYQYDKAVETYQQSLSLRRAVQDREAIGRALFNLAHIYRRLGQDRQALTHSHEALPFLEGSGDCRALALLYDQLGALYEQVGQNKRAQRHFCKALPLSIALEQSGDAASILNSLGRSSHFLGDPREALGFYQRAMSVLGDSGDANIRAIILTNAGHSHNKLEEYAQALEKFDEALGLRRQQARRRSEAVILSEMGSVHRDQGAFDTALGLYQQALALARDVEDGATEAMTYLRMADAERRRDRFAVALAYLEEGLAMIEARRSQVPDPYQRATYLSYKNRFYELQFDVLMASHFQDPAAGYDEQALRASDGARARSLVDVLEGQVGIGRGADATELDRLNALELQLSRLEQQRRELSEAGGSSPRLVKIQEEITSTLAIWQHQRSLILESSPSYQQLTDPEALSVDQMRGLLDEGTVLLEYALGRERSFWWMVTGESFESGELPPRTEIEDLARRIYSQVQSRSGWDEEAYLEAAARLSEILFGPVADHLDAQRLVVIAGGALQYVPFAALPVPGTVQRDAVGSATSWTPLIAQHELVSLPSASVLAIMRRESSNGSKASKSLAVIADPVFSEVPDPEEGDWVETGSLSSPCGTPIDSTDTLDTLATLAPVCLASEAPADGMAFPRLVFSREEAKTLLARVPNSEARSFLGHEASREMVLTGELSSYRILHFATHGVLDTENPELSALVLSQMDAEGRPIEGFLRLYDIYNLQLRAELVVLSACRTALGQELKGEGLVGLTRGFMYAGAPRVVASLWAVEDKATLRLMDRYYQAMLEEDQRPAAALQQAQKAMWEAGRAPYEWAAFVHHGEWR